MAEPTKEERDHLLYKVRVGLQTKVAPVERDEQVDAVEAVFDVVPDFAAGAVLDALNPAGEKWHAVASYFANENTFSRAARRKALEVLAARAGRKPPAIQRIPHPGGRVEGGGKPNPTSRGTAGRTTARAAVDGRGLDARKEACNKSFAGKPPHWHALLFADLNRVGADKTEAGVVAALERHVPDDGAPRLFARLCSARDAFGKWFGNPTNIPTKSRAAALDHLADEMGLPRPKEARKATRPATGAPETPLQAITDPIDTQLTVEVLTHGLELSRFAKLRAALEAEKKLAYWTLSLRYGNPDLDRTRPNVSTAAAGGADPLPWFKWEELDKAARAKGLSQKYFETLIADFEREFATVVAGALRNVFAFYRKQLDAWRKRVTTGGLAELVVASAREQALAVAAGSSAYPVLRVERKSFYQVPETVLSGLVRHEWVMDRLSDVLNSRQGPHRVKGVRDVLLAYIDARKSDVDDANAQLEDGPMRIYDRPPDLRSNYAELFSIAPNTIAFDIVWSAKGPATSRRLLMGMIGLALLLIPGGTVVRLMIAALGAYEVATEVEEYEFDRALHSLGLLRDRPGLFWVALTIIGGFFDVAQGIAPAAKLLLRASQAAGKGASTMAVLLRAKQLAPTAAVRTHLDRAIAAQRAIEIADAAKKSAKPPLMLAGLGAGTFLPPIPAPWTLERLRKFILAKMAGGVASVEQLIHSLRASSAFRKLSAADQKRLVKALSSEARTILRFGQQWSGRARTGLAKRIATGPLARYADLLDQFIDTHWDDAFYLATRRLDAWRKRGRSAIGARNGLKGVIQEMLGDLQTVHRHHREAARRGLPKGWSAPRFFRNVKDASGALTDGIWMTKNESSGLWLLLHINEFKSKSNWRDLYRTQIREDIRRLRGTIQVDGKELIFGKDFKIVSDVFPDKPLRFALALPREMVRGTPARKKLRDEAKKVFAQENFPAIPVPVNSPLPPGVGAGRKGFDDLIAEAILDAVDGAM